MQSNEDESEFENIGGLRTRHEREERRVSAHSPVLGAHSRAWCMSRRLEEPSVIAKECFVS